MASQSNVKQNIIARFFQYLSKTDPNMIESPTCSKADQMTQTMLGVMVFITGIFAFLAAAFAMMTAFDDLRIAISVGMIWALIIIWFDRAIVSTKDKTAILLRLPIALVIGFTVSIPLEIRLFRDRLDKYLEEQSKIENKDVIDRKNQLLKRMREKNDRLETDSQKYRNKISKWSENMEAEVVGRQLAGRTGQPGPGPAFREAERNKILNEQNLRDIEKQMRELTSGEAEELQKIDKEFNDNYVKQQFGFLSRYESLETIKNQSSSAAFLANLLRILFVFIELFPALLKLFLPYSVYDAALEARRREEIQKIHTRANATMAKT